MNKQELHTKVIDLRDTFTIILDTEGETLNGALRVKMAKAELLLNRLGLLLEKDNG